METKAPSKEDLVYVVDTSNSHNLKIVASGKTDAEALDRATELVGSDAFGLRCLRAGSMSEALRLASQLIGR